MKNKLLRRVVFGLVASIILLGFTLGGSAAVFGDYEYENYGYEDYDYGEYYEDYDYEDYGYETYEDYEYENYGYEDYDYGEYYKGFYSVVLNFLKYLFERFPALENAFAFLF